MSRCDNTAGYNPQQSKSGRGTFLTKSKRYFFRVNNNEDRGILEGEQFLYESVKE